MRKHVSRRYLAVWLPQLPLDRWERREDPRLAGPFAITQRKANADRILCANAAAVAQGVRMGQSFTDALAVCPDVLSEAEDTVREAKLLAALRKWADRFSPLIAVHGSDGLLMDITGCATVFDGEDKLAGAVHSGLSDLSVMSRIGVANTKLAANGFARSGRAPIHITQSTQEAQEVEALPISALGLDNVVALDFRRLGVKTIGDLSKFKTSELARRFSVYVPQALEALRGHRHDPLVPSSAPRVFSASQNLPEPIGRVEDVLGILQRLAERVCRDLTEAGQAARGYRFTVRCVDTGDHPLEIGLSSPGRDVQPLIRQFRRPVEALKIEFGADWFRLLALNVEVFRPSQGDLEDTDAQGDVALQQTLTTLGNRLGFDRLRHPVEGHGRTPEHENGSHEVGKAEPRLLQDPLSKPSPNYPRPEIVWPPAHIRVEAPGHPPRRYAYKGKTFNVVRWRGPERVSPIWWRYPSDPIARHTRDYWRATTDEGRCFWLMTLADAPDEGWFCCGEFLVEPCFTYARSRG